jgi:hypothetical protein
LNAKASCWVTTGVMALIGRDIVVRTRELSVRQEAD